MSSLLEHTPFYVTMYDEDIPCQGYDETCGQPARWRIIFTCCANQRNACDECKAKEDELAVTRRGLRCQFCDARPALFKWRPL